MKYRSNYGSLAAALLALAAALTGCAKDGQTGGPGNHSGASAFERMKDPPINAATYYAAGQLAESRGELDAAIAEYRHALVTDKDHAPSMYRLGCLYAQQKRFGESVAMWRRYLKATGDAAAGYSNLAFTEELAGNPAGAEADYLRGINKDPQNEPCRVNYGLMLARHGRVAEATLQLQTVLTPAQAHYNLATVHELQHRKDLAKAEYERAIALDPNFADARTKLASLGE